VAEAVEEEAVQEEAVADVDKQLPNNLIINVIPGV
jgi:hypothetical protein